MPTPVYTRFKTRYIIALSILGTIGLILGLSPDLKTESEWYRFQARRLSTIQITPERIASAKPWRKSVCISVYIMEKREGVIPIGANDGVYVVFHSFHDDERDIPLLFLKALSFLIKREPIVSDAILAVDQHGKMYTCKGHNCGALLLRSSKDVTTLEDFLQIDHDGHKWEPYQPN